MSLETPDMPSTPDFLFMSSETCFVLKFMCSMMKRIAIGSTSPQRVPITSPGSGVRPIEVSMTLPFFTAVSEAPLPMWHTMIFLSLISQPKNSQALADTYLTEVPWNP